METALFWGLSAPFFKHHNMHVLLLAEDPADHANFERSTVKLGAGWNFTACTSVAEPWTMLSLRRMSPPSLIFVDFELSRTYDHELVQILKNNPDLGTAPVIVFADSIAQEEVVSTYRLQVACLVVFPTDSERRQEKIQVCLDFWANYAELPEMRKWWGEA